MNKIYKEDEMDKKDVRLEDLKVGMKLVIKKIGMKFEKYQLNGLNIQDEDDNLVKYKVGDIVTIAVDQFSPERLIFSKDLEKDGSYYLININKDNNLSELFDYHIEDSRITEAGFTHKGIVLGDEYMYNGYGKTRKVKVIGFDVNDDDLYMVVGDSDNKWTLVKNHDSITHYLKECGDMGVDFVHREVLNTPEEPVDLVESVNTSLKQAVEISETKNDSLESKQPKLEKPVVTKVNGGHFVEVNNVTIYIDNRMGYAESTCHPDDEYNQEVGRALAYYRLYKDMMYEDRGAIKHAPF